jgi:hypothetical protein
MSENIYNCSLIDFRNLTSFQYNYKKNDFIENYLIDNDTDILFIINYYNNSLDADIENTYDNVFVSNIEENYNIFKGITKNNVCNIILVKNIYKHFVIKDKYYNNYNYTIQPLIIYSYFHNLTLICVDETLKYKVSHKLIEKLLKNNNTIIAGCFGLENKVHKYNNQLLLFNDYHYGLVFKRFNGKGLAVLKSNFFDNSIVSCFLQQDNQNIIQYYFSKFNSLFS